MGKTTKKVNKKANITSVTMLQEESGSNKKDISSKERKALTAQNIAKDAEVVARQAQKEAAHAREQVERDQVKLQHARDVFVEAEQRALHPDIHSQLHNQQH